MAITYDRTRVNVIQADLKGQADLLGAIIDLQIQQGANSASAGDASAANQVTEISWLTAIDGHVDGIETLITSSNTKLDTLHTDLGTTLHGDFSTLFGYVDGIEGGLGAVADAAVSNPASSGSVIALTKGQMTLFGALTEAAPASDTASSGLNGRLQRIAQRITSMIAQIPAALGQTTKSASMSVVLASDDDVQAKLGIVTETAPATDTASSGLNGRLQRIAQRLTSLIALVPASLGTKTAANSFAVVGASDDAVQGAVNETAPASDTASSGHNGRLQRIAQRLTSLIALLPSAIGRTTSSGSLSTVTASDDAMIGIVTETAPASDTASSGLNGRLQRIAQRITSLIALLPTALGQSTMANSLRVVLPSDQSAIPVNPISGQTGIAGNSGLVGATVTRTVDADDSGPTSTSRIVSSAATTNATSGKGSAGVLFGAKGYNASSAVKYLKIYNKATAPTVGTDTPVLTLALPPLAAFAFDWPGRYLATGIAYALTGGSADADTTALASGDVLGLNLDYR